MDNTNELLYPIGTLVRYKCDPEDAGYVHNIILSNRGRLPTIYVVKMFKDGALMHSSEQHLEAIPVENR